MIDGGNSLRAGKAHSEYTKMTLQSRVDRKTTRGGIHTRYVLAIVNIFQSELIPIVPMTVIHVLSDQCMRLNRSVGIHLWHVHVVDITTQHLSHILNRSACMTSY